MATISNLFIDAGSDYATNIYVKAANGQPLDLTNYTAKSQMRKSYQSSQAFNFVATILDAARGIIRLSIDADTTNTIPPGRWLYDVEITNTNSSVRKRVVEGIATITPQVTQI